MTYNNSGIDDGIDVGKSGIAAFIILILAVSYFVSQNVDPVPSEFVEEQTSQGQGQAKANKSEIEEFGQFATVIDKYYFDKEGKSIGFVLRNDRGERKMIEVDVSTQVILPAVGDVWNLELSEDGKLAFSTLRRNVSVSRRF